MEADSVADTGRKSPVKEHEVTASSSALPTVADSHTTCVKAVGPENTDNQAATIDPDADSTNSAITTPETHADTESDTNITTPETHADIELDANITTPETHADTADIELDANITTPETHADTHADIADTDNNRTFKYPQTDESDINFDTDTDDHIAAQIDADTSRTKRHNERRRKQLLKSPPPPPIDTPRRKVKSGKRKRTRKTKTTTINAEQTVTATDDQQETVIDSPTNNNSQANSQVSESLIDSPDNNNSDAPYETRVKIIRALELVPSESHGEIRIFHSCPEIFPHSPHIHIWHTYQDYYTVIDFSSPEHPSGRSLGTGEAHQACTESYYEITYKVYPTIDSDNTNIESDTEPEDSAILRHHPRIANRTPDNQKKPAPVHQTHSAHPSQDNKDYLIRKMINSRTHAGVSSIAYLLFRPRFRN